MSIQPPSEMVYRRPQAFTDVATHYCPGCTHGIAHRLVAEVLDEMDLLEKTIGVASVGCSVFAYNYFDCDFVEAAHGRAPAMATGIKRVLPDRFVFTYQGDGDLASIGMGEIIHAAARGENITVIFINNAIYGMTGGQMAPTTLLGQVTTSSPFGRESVTMGNPLKITELLAQLPGAYYVSRHSIFTSNAIRKLKKAITKSFEYQKEKKGTCFIEVVSNCPSGWKMTPVESMEWIEEHMLPIYPLGDLKVPKIESKAAMDKPN